MSKPKFQVSVKGIPGKSTKLFEFNLILRGFSCEPGRTAVDVSRETLIWLLKYLLLCYQVPQPGGNEGHYNESAAVHF
jgi:hypothetical protein